MKHETITQDFIDGLDKGMEETRSNYHITLGELIKRLEAAPPTMQVIAELPVHNVHISMLKDKNYVPSNERKRWGVGKGDSYRGYYSDVAFEPMPVAGGATVGLLLKECRNLLGSEVSGYKGGEFLMEDTTPVWISEWGVCSGNAVVDVRILDGEFFLVIKPMGRF